MILSKIFNLDQIKQFNAKQSQICVSCGYKDLEIARLKKEVSDLKKQLKNRKEKPYGIHTPSSKCLDHHTGNPKSESKKRGGAKPGHEAHNRPAPDPTHADEMIKVEMPNGCPHCGGKLKPIGMSPRRVLDISLNKIKDIYYEIIKGECSCCGKIITSPVGALPRMLLGNRLLADIAVSHYLHGISLGRITARLGLEIGLSTVLSNLSKFGELCASSHDDLVSDFRLSYVRHADETGWNCFGKRGYGWIFSSAQVTLFSLESSRGSVVPKAILGAEPLDGCLVVDRYSAYNRLPVRLQYCYAHLLRDLEALGEEFSENKEVKSFVDEVRPLLSSAMNLRGLKILDEVFYKRAEEIADSLHAIMSSDANHFGIKNYQSIFLDHADRMYLWSKDRKIPADNNRAEREIRNLVIARKISYESKSRKSAKMRSHIMSFLFTLKKRLNSNEDIVEWLAQALDKICSDPNLTLYDLLPQTYDINGTEKARLTTHFYKSTYKAQQQQNQQAQKELYH